MVARNEMGRVTCEVRVENAIDSAKARSGEIPNESVRSVQISDALIDTGASTLALPKSMIRQLGFDKPITTKRSRNTTGVYEANLYGPVRLWIFDRDMTLDVLETAEGSPVLIGQLPLEHMQLIVDMANHKITKSSANNGEWVLDMFGCECD